jgi:hypothetical protein
MRHLRSKIGGGLGGMLLVLTLVACGSEAEATSRPQNLGTAIATTGAGPTATRGSFPGSGGPPATPILQRPTGTITPIFERPTGTIFARPTGSPDLPIIGGQPTVTPSANAVAPNSDGTCPGTHPIKASQLGPVKSYFLSDHPAYTRTRATECFATESDAQAAGYRKAAG